MKRNPEYRYALVPIDMPDGKKVGFVVRIGPPPPPAEGVRRKHKAIIAAAGEVPGEAIVDQGKTRTFDTKSEAETYGKKIGYAPKRYLDSTKGKKSMKAAANPKKGEPKDLHGTVLGEGDYVSIDDEPGLVSSLFYDDENQGWVMEANKPYLEAVDVQAGESPGYTVGLLQVREGVWEDLDTDETVKVEYEPPPEYASNPQRGNPMTDVSYEFSEPHPGSPHKGDPLPPTHPHLYGGMKPSIKLFDHVKIFTEPGWLKGQVLDISGVGWGMRYLVKTKDGYMLVHEHHIEYDRPAPRTEKARSKLYAERREAMRGLSKNPSESVPSTSPEPNVKKLKTRLLK